MKKRSGVHRCPITRRRLSRAAAAEPLRKTDATSECARGRPGCNDADTALRRRIAQRRTITWCASARHARHTRARRGPRSCNDVVDLLRRGSAGAPWWQPQHFCSPPRQPGRQRVCFRSILNEQREAAVAGRDSGLDGRGRACLHAGGVRSPATGSGTETCSVLAGAAPAAPVGPVRGRPAVGRRRRLTSSSAARGLDDHAAGCPSGECVSAS